MEKLKTMPNFVENHFANTVAKRCLKRPKQQHIINGVFLNVQYSFHSQTRIRIQTAKTSL